MGLGDLEELVLSCRTDEARSYISEAVACYKAGASRACIVSTWIAVVFDLIEKIRELSLAGDAEAQRIIADLTTWQPLIERGDQVAIRRSLEFERDIVVIANDRFGFFDGLQVLDLTRLRDDRNRCAHPTYQGTGQPYSPTPELARAHLVHAVRHVLSQPPVQGKAATEHIIRLVESAYFPNDLEQAKVQLSAGWLARPKESLVKSVVDKLAFGMLEGEPALKGRPQTAIALRATCEMFPGICEPRIARDLNLICRRIADRDLPLLVMLQRFFPATWGFLEQDNRQKMAQLIRQSSNKLAVYLIPICLDIGDLREVCRNRLNDLEAKDLGEVLQKTSDPVAVDRALDLYCSARSYDEANSRYEDVIRPVLDRLDEAQLRRILNAAREEHADLNGAHSFTEFVQKIYQTQRLPRDEIIAALTAQGMEWLVVRLEPDDEPAF